MTSIPMYSIFQFVLHESEDGLLFQHLLFISGPFPKARRFYSPPGIVYVLYISRGREHTLNEKEGIVFFIRCRYILDLSPRETIVCSCLLVLFISGLLISMKQSYLSPLLIVDKFQVSLDMRKDAVLPPHVFFFLDWST